MFKTGEYKIVFKRSWHYVQAIEEGGADEPVNGRYDTVCEIYVDDETKEVPRFTGIAKLHPNDEVDKIVGKQVALTKALSSGGSLFTKAERTEIWKAFWEWVASWSPRNTREIGVRRLIEKGKELKQHEEEQEKTS